MPRKGRSLERLVASLEKTLAGNSSVKEIDSPKYLTDRITGKPREHDVVLTLEQGHHNILIAIECRDRSRPVGVSAIEAFKTKCEDTGINQGIMVSSSGFYKSARRKAEFIGIRCLTMANVEAFDWLLASGITQREKKLLSHGWTFFPVEEGLVTKENMEVLCPDGQPLTQELMKENSIRFLDLLLPTNAAVTEKSVLRQRVEAEGLILRNSETGDTSPVSWIGVELAYSITDRFVPFQLKKYHDTERDAAVTEFALADFHIKGHEGRFMFVKADDGSIKVLFDPGPREAE